METDIYNNQVSTSFSTYLAIASFTFGTLLLLLHLSFPQEVNVLIIGFFYVLFAILLNSLAFFNLCYQFIIKPPERETIAIRILILLANIPIATLYFYIVINN